MSYMAFIRKYSWSHSVYSLKASKYLWRLPRHELFSCPQRCITLCATRFKDDPGAQSSPTSLKTSDPNLGYEVPATVNESVPSQTANITQHVDFSSLGLGGYHPSGVVQSTLELMYNHLHLPWWGSIATIALLIRIALFPLSVKSAKVSARLKMLNHDAAVINAKIQRFRDSGDRLGVSKGGIELLQLYKRNHAHPFSLLYIWMVQLPVMFFVFCGLRGMITLESFHTGGTLWFKDLIIPDPTFALPLIACGLYFTNLQLGNREIFTNTDKISRVTRWILCGGTLCILPIVISLPSAVLVYFVANSMISTVLILTFKLRLVKKLLRF